MSQLYFEIDKYSHHFTLSKISHIGRAVIADFSKPYMQWGMVRENRRFFRKVIKVFGTRSHDYSQYRYHIEQYKDLITFFKDNQINDESYVVREHVPIPGQDTNMLVNPGWVPKDYQEPIVDYLGQLLPSPRKLVEIQTGAGKSAIAMFDICKKSKRVVILVKPMFMEKWLADVQKISNTTAEDVMLVSGSLQLMKLITMAKEGLLTSKVIIISNKTMQNWITLYEKIGDEIELLGYDCKPQELMEVLQAGLRLIDEVHMDFHLNFKLDLYTHIAWSTSLSATLVADDPFLTKMYELAYPKSARYAGLAYNKYIHSFSWIYRFNRPELIKTHEFGQTAYSHTAFEKSLLKRPVELASYIEMIDACIKQTFLNGYKKGDKLLVYCSSINMCTAVSNRLKVIHKSLDVRRYVEDDPYNNLMEAEICVSTLLSAGTGHDIPGLTTVILTSAVSSTQSNIQGFGRLREIKGREVNFIYFVCSDYQKHIDYHEKKKLILKSIALSYNSLSYPHFIG